MIPPELEGHAPKHPFPEKHETLTDIEKNPPRSFQDKMKRDHEFREWAEEHT